MKYYRIDSVILEEDAVRKDAEPYAILYDFLTRADNSWLRGQKTLLRSGLVLIAIGIIYLVLGPIMPMIVGFCLAFIGILLILFMLSRRPKGLRTVRKLFWPMGLMPMPASDVDAVVTLDCTKKVWSTDSQILVANSTHLSSLLQRLPESMENYAAEERNLQALRSMQDLVKEVDLRSNHSPDDYMSKVHRYGREVNAAPENTMPGMDPLQTRAEADRISTLLETAKGQVVIAEATKETLRERVDIYLGRLEAVHKAEAEYMISSIARFNQEVGPSCDFFEPLIESFKRDVKDDLLLLDSFSLRELDIIEERMTSDQRYIDVMLDRLSLMLKDLEQKMIKDGRLRRSSLEAMEELRKTVRTAKEENVRPVEPSISEVMRTERNPEPESVDLRQLMLDTLLGAEGMWRYLEIEGGRAVSPNVLHFIPPDLAQAVHVEAKDERATPKLRADLNDPLVASQIKRYDSMADRARKHADSIRMKMTVLVNVMDGKGDELRSTVEDTLKRIDSQLIAGRRFIELTDISKEEDHARVRRDVDGLERMQSFIAQAVLDAEAMMVEETARHLRPFAERGNTFEEERLRLQSVFDDIIKADEEFEKILEGTIFHCPRPGMYYLPTWLVESSNKRDVRAIGYGLCVLDQNGFLKGRFKDLSLTPEQIRSMAGEVTGIDQDLLKDIGESYRAFRSRAKVSSLDAYLVYRGVKGLAKAR